MTTLTTLSNDNLCLLVVWPGEHRLGRRGAGRQYHGRQLVQVLYTRRADAFDLALGVELDRPTEGHLVGDVGLADRVGQRLRIGGLGALERIGGDQDRLEREADIEAVEHQLV